MIVVERQENGTIHVYTNYSEALIVIIDNVGGKIGNIAFKPVTMGLPQLTDDLLQLVVEEL